MSDGAPPTTMFGDGAEVMVDVPGVVHVASAGTDRCKWCGAGAGPGVMLLREVDFDQLMRSGTIAFGPRTWWCRHAPHCRPCTEGQENCTFRFL